MKEAVTDLCAKYGWNLRKGTSQQQVRGKPCKGRTEEKYEFSSRMKGGN
jgi:hypothetical protein